MSISLVNLYSFAMNATRRKHCFISKPAKFYLEHIVGEPLKIVIVNEHFCVRPSCQIAMRMKYMHIIKITEYPLTCSKYVEFNPIWSAFQRRTRTISNVIIKSNESKKSAPFHLHNYPETIFIEYVSACSAR